MAAFASLINRNPREKNQYFSSLVRVIAGNFYTHMESNQGNEKRVTKGEV
jgi:hypothetical protein